MENKENMEEQNAPEMNETENTADTDNTTATEEAEASKESADEEPVEKTHEEELEESLEQAQLQLAQMQDKYLRQIADFDNYRKNKMKEMSELVKNASERLIVDLLPILDDFQRAMKAMESAEDVASVREGVELIRQKFMRILSSKGLKAIETENQDFDVEYHEAIAMVPAPADELKGKVLDCVETGYMLNDKVIRHSKVAVGQ